MHLNLIMNFAFSEFTTISKVHYVNSTNHNISFAILRYVTPKLISNYNLLRFFALTLIILLSK